MRRILITTGMERSTRALLRSSVFKLLSEKYEIIIASLAEQSKQWKEEFININDNVRFFEEIKTDSFTGLTILKQHGIDLVLSAENSDVPAHMFDVSFQRQALVEKVPVICLQNFIDIIFHPMDIIPDRFLCWGEFFKHQLLTERTVLLWNKKTNCINESGNVDGLFPGVLDVCGVPHFDDYYYFQNEVDKQIRKKYTCEKLELDINKPIFLHNPNGDFAEWVFNMADDYFECARNLGAQMIVKVHPIRHNDAWIFNLVASKYKEVPYRLVFNNSYCKGTAMGVSGYSDNLFYFDKSETDQLGYLFNCADVVSSCASTTNLESMIFDKPNVIYTNYWNQSMKVRQSIMKWYWKQLGETYKSCDLADSKENLLKLIQENLENPDKNKEGRKNIVKDFFYKVDGNSGRRVFESIDKYIKENIG